MTSELITIGVIVILRLWSAIEHRSTGKEVKDNGRDIKEIKIYMNGELEKKLQEKYNEGFSDGKNSK